MNDLDASLQGTQVRQPLLNRLLDAEPDVPRDVPQTTMAMIDRMRQAVRRDLEAMLNARRRRRPLPAGLPELRGSLLAYGIPDPTAGSFTDEGRRQNLATEVETAVRRFEPRLTEVHVTLATLPREQREPLDRVLSISIEAVLRSDPIPEQVAFETMLRPVSMDVAVREG